MARLSFDRKTLNELLQQAITTHARQLILVGDHGVYFMNPAQPPPRTCVYATGCNPSTDEAWYDLKRRTFGGDDGSEPFQLASIARWLKPHRQRDAVIMEISASKIVLLA